MRIMMMHKTNAQNEAGVLPGPEIIEGMGKLMGQLAQSGALLDGGGLQRTANGVRLNFVNGRRTITKGPYTGHNELMAGFAILRLKSMDEAIEQATRFAGIVGDVEIDIRPLVEAWDLGAMPKPADVTTTRYMMHHKADKISESGAPPSPRVMEEMGKFVEELSKQGVLLAGEGLHPSSKAKRLTMKGGKCTIIDGPFAESKELVAGFVMLKVNSIDDAIVWAKPFAEIVGDVEIDLRQVFEESDFAQA